MANKSTLTVEVEGLEAIFKELERRDLNAYRELTAIVTAGAEVVLEDAKERSTSRRVRDALITKVTGRKGKLVEVGVGPDTRRVRWSHFLEFGVSPHVQPNFKPYGRLAPRAFLHPGMKAQPFLRPAFDAKKDAARDAMAEALKEVLGTE